MLKVTTLFTVIVISTVLTIACSPTLIDKLDKHASEALSIGDWGEASYYANQMYDLYNECSAENLASLALIYNKLASLTTDIDTRRRYVHRVVECYEGSIKKDANKANRKYKDAQVKMSEAVRRYLQTFSQFEN